MNEDRPFLHIPLPSEEDRRLFEEWLKKKQEEYLVKKALKDNAKAKKEKERLARRKRR